MEYFIYEIRNIINGKRYIGCSKDVTVRFTKHQSRLKNNKHVNSYLQNAYNKYGKSNFEYNILFKLNSESDMYKKEKELILENDNLYNLAEGGLGGDTYSNRTEEQMEITRKKLSDIAKVRNQKNIELHRENTSKLWENEEYREKVSKGIKKALQNPEIKQKWSDCKKGSNNGRWNGYLLICKDGEVLEKHESIIEASRQTGINRDTISKKTKDGKPYKYKDSKYNGCTFQLDAGGGCDA
jgi:group I intron endonuclease